MPSPLVALRGALVTVRNSLPRLIGDYSWLDSAYVAVGWDAQSGKYPDGTPVAVVAISNEFGTYNEDGSVHVPARPFMRPAYAENRPALLALRQQVVHRINEGRLTPEKALDTMGFRLMTMVRRKILSNVGPPLAASTLARKRAQGRPAVTLINTRRMLDELTYHIYTRQLRDGQQTDTAKAAQASGRAASIKANAVGRERQNRIRTAKQIKNEKAALRRELKKAKLQAKAKSRRDKKKVVAANKRAKKQAAHETRMTKRAFARARVGMRRRAQKQARRLNRVAKRAARRQRRAKARIVRKNQRQLRNDFRRARKAQTRTRNAQARSYRKFRAKQKIREKKELRKRIGRFKKIKARSARANAKAANHNERVYKKHVARMMKRAGRQLRGLRRIEKLSPEQRLQKAAKEKERRAQRVESRRVKRTQQREKKQKTQAERRARKSYNPNITLGED